MAEKEQLIEQYSGWIRFVKHHIHQLEPLLNIR